MGKSNIIILSALAASTINTKVVAQEKREQPNILMIVCEDISPYLGCYGDKIAKTPNLDKFASEGILHTNMFTCVGVSSPSRYSLITGRYATEDGANFMRVNYFDKEINTIAPEGVKCYTEYLREAGYYCTNNAKTDYQFDVPLSAWDEQGNQAHWKNTPDGMPFFSIFNLNITHESQIWRNSDEPLLVDPDSIVVPPYFPDNDVVRHDMAVMYSNITKMDTEFQQLVDELNEAGKADNTIIIFYSDNGGPLPRGKREILDSGTRVPFMIKFPNGKDKGEVNSDLNMFVDIPATVLSLAGIPTPSYMHGQAMYGEYANEKKREYVFGATNRFDEQVEKRASIRNNRYLYVKNYLPSKSNYKPNTFRLQMPMMQNMEELRDIGKLNKTQMLWFNAPAPIEELYDCENDPHQINNLIHDDIYSKVLKKMRSAFKEEWIEKYNSFWVVSDEDDFHDRLWINGKNPTAESPIFEISENEISFGNNTQKVSISYQINGQGLNSNKNHWHIFNESFVVQAGDEVTAVVSRIGYNPSDTVKVKLNK